MLTNSSILVTGGTGSFGKVFTRTVLERYPDIKRLVIFSRDELKQFEMAQTWNDRQYPGLRYFLGDIRDAGRVRRALEGIDYVIHAAALKQVVAAEYNPFEFIQTNVMGAHNIINGCMDNNVKKVVALSTDKAAAPINLYGATKLCSDKLFASANNIRGKRDLRFSVVRYGNVMGSRGSVIPFFLDRRASGVLPITSTDMTRFNISLQEGVEMVLWALENMHGGEIFVPKIPSYRITDVATAIGPECRQEVVGIRPGEKVHEEMITVTDGYDTVDLGKHFAIMPSFARDTSSVMSLDEYCRATGATRVPEGFFYNSGTNPDFLTVPQIRDLIRTYVKPDFRA
jgi:UDP-N-acetylglucosamine 4,6-dehydratase (inverting)